MRVPAYPNLSMFVPPGTTLQPRRLNLVIACAADWHYRLRIAIHGRFGARPILDKTLQICWALLEAGPAVSGPGRVTPHIRRRDERYLGQ